MVFWKLNANLLSICSLDVQLKVFGQSQLENWKRERNCTQLVGTEIYEAALFFRASTVGFMEITRTVGIIFCSVPAVRRH